MSDRSSDPDRIERDLNRTRSRLGSTLDELQERLTPGQVVDDLMAYFRGSDGAEFGRNLLENAKANPIPAALTAVSLTWLMASQTRPDAAPDTAQVPPRRRVYHYYSGEDAEGLMSRLRTAEQGVVRGTDETEETYGGRLDAARGQALGLAQHAQESAQSFAERVRNAMDSARESVSDAAQGLRDKLGESYGSMADSARAAGQKASDYATRNTRAAGEAGGHLLGAISDNPVILGAIGLAAGALLGSLVPQSEQEEAALGDVAAQARSAVRGAAEEAKQRGTAAARAALDSAREKADEKGLTGDRSPGDLADAALQGKLTGEVREVASAAMSGAAEAGRDSARRDGEQGKSRTGEPGKSGRPSGT